MRFQNLILVEFYFLDIFKISYDLKKINCEKLMYMNFVWVNNPKSL
jgi:hypothetical protein